jgi:hypothetical protein
MNKRLLLSSIALFLLLGLVLSSTAVQAISAEARPTPRSAPQRSVSGDDKTVTVEQREVVKQKLTDAKLTICKKREASINSAISRITDRDNKRMEYFTNVVSKVTLFYTSSELSIDNYDQLVTIVNEKKATASAVIAASALPSAAPFECSAGDPKGVVIDFKAAHAKIVDALKEYKTAISNLTTTIKSAAEATKPSTGANE